MSIGISLRNLRRMVRRGAVAAESSPTPTPTPTPTPVLDLLSAEARTNYDEITGVFAGLFNGYQGDGTDFYSDVEVTTDDALNTAVTNAYNARGNGRWHRIRLGNGGTFTSDRWINGDFLQDGTGGLLIEPSPGAVYTLSVPEGKEGWETPSPSQLASSGRDIGAMRGVHFRNLTFTFPANATCIKAANLPSPTGSTKAHAVVVEGCTFTSSDGTDRNGAIALFFQHAEVVRVRNCQIIGAGAGGDNIRSINSYATEIDGVDFTRYNVDLIGFGVFTLNSPSVVGIWPSEERYLWVHNCTARDQIDNWGGYVTATEPHVDFIQSRASRTLWSAGVAVTAGRVYENGQNVYQAATSGTTGVTGPTHTSGTVSDGAVDWLFVGTREQCAARICGHDNFIHSTGQTFSDITAKFISGGHQFYIDSEGAFHKSVFFNNISATRIARGIREAENPDSGFINVEYNTFIGPNEAASTWSATHTNASVYADQEITGREVRARRNIAGLISGAGSFALNVDEDNLVAKFAGWSASGSSAAENILTGPFTRNAVTDSVEYALNDSNTYPVADFRADLIAVAKPLAAYLAYGYQEA